MKKLDKTDIIDMQSELDKEIPNLRTRISPFPTPATNQDALIEKLLKEKPEILKSYLDEKTLHNSLNMVDPEAIDWANNTRLQNIQLRNSRVPKIRAAGIIGALMGLASGDVTAAIPGLSEAESLEPSPEDAIIENPQANPELRKAALQKIMGR